MRVAEISACRISIPEGIHSARLIPSLKFTWLEGQEKEEALHTFKELGSNEEAPLEKNDSCDTSDNEANFFNVVKRGEVSPASDELLRDAIANDGNMSDIGRLVILPSTFTGSPRHMHEYAQDAMSYVRA
ncbi:hypothetical protein J437_LFUL015379 [Ladona fulva]|uniref:Helitron helicase-like domain-containing protein n=1 Tax=Ladona fulva TaxID=123851 RepID=A0A8K0P8B5_LADFU|nr:hypothetical protein J437_LFUL015379 [Ladona fulva]